HCDTNLRIDVNTPVYISLDLDGLDPAFAPGVSHREPGGLSTRQVINLIHTLDQPIVAADIVEYNPRCDFSNVTATVAAKLLKEIGGVIVKTHSWWTGQDASVGVAPADTRSNMPPLQFGAHAM